MGGGGVRSKTNKMQFFLSKGAMTEVKFSSTNLRYCLSICINFHSFTYNEKQFLTYFSIMKFVLFLILPVDYFAHILYLPNTHNMIYF